MVVLAQWEWQNGWSGDGATERCGECERGGGRVERRGVWWAVAVDVEDEEQAPEVRG